MSPPIINGSKIPGLIKKYFPDNITIIGGSHSSAIPEQTLEEFPCFDLVVNREGEETLAEVCDRVLNGEESTGVMGATWWMGQYRQGAETPADSRAGLAFFSRTPSLIGQRLPSGSRNAGLHQQRDKHGFLYFHGGPFKSTFCEINTTVGCAAHFRSSDNNVQEIEERAPTIASNISPSRSTSGGPTI